MTIIDSLKRLERAGGEHSRATQKLHEAVREVADLIERTAPRGVELPRGYVVRDLHSNIGATTLLYRKSGHVDPYDGSEIERPVDYDGPRYLHGDFGTDMSGCGQTRARSLRFAADVADGLLDDIAAFLESRAAEAAAATATLETATAR